MDEFKRSERYQASLTDDGRYRLLVEAVTDYAIYMVSPEGLITTWNRGATRIKGYEQQEIIGQHFSRFYPDPDRAAGLPAQGLASAREHGSYETEGWRIRKDGSRFWAHVIIDPVFDDSGALVAYAKITRDLSERRQSAEDLRHSEEQFKLLVQSVTDYAIYMLDPHGRITNWNAGAQRLKGYRPDEIIGEHYSRFYPEEERRQGIPERNLRIAAKEGRFEKEGWRVRKDGTQFWANVVIDPIYGDNGTLLGFAKITRDFTERRESQRALEEAREALFRAQKLEAIGKLTGGVAHDFNNLLMAIMGSLALVEKRLPDDDRKITPLLKNAYAAAQRGAALTQRMLVFARRQTLNPETTDLPSLVRGMSDLLQRSIGPVMQIQTRFPLSLPPVMVDPTQLESGLLNLTLNARDAMPDGGVITISAQTDQMMVAGAPVPAVRFAVSDTGVGMDDDTLMRATEPFFTTKGIGKGTGLGLSMVQGLAEQSNGRLVIRSKLGEGTTVEIWLPAADQSRERQEKVAAATPSPAVDMQPLVILAVDDDGLVLMNTEAMLEDLGHKVLTATSGTEAVDILRRGMSVDLVLTDQAMPNMTGHQLADLIEDEWPGLPIILATGYAELPAGSGAGIPRLSKPYLQADLAAAISAAMKGRVQQGNGV